MAVDKVAVRAAVRVADVEREVEHVPDDVEVEPEPAPDDVVGVGGDGVGCCVLCVMRRPDEQLQREL